MDWHEVGREWEPLLARLRDEGFSVELTSLAFPVQLQGRLPDGELFYFRERTGHCYLGVGGEDPVDAAAWQVTEDLWGEREQGRFLHPRGAYEVLKRLLDSR